MPSAASSASAARGDAQFNAALALPKAMVGGDGSRWSAPVLSWIDVSWVRRESCWLMAVVAWWLCEFAHPVFDTGVLKVPQFQGGDLTGNDTGFGGG